MKTLSKPFLKVKSKRETAYGGNQGWFSRGFLKKYGCGVVSAADVLLCLEGKTYVTEEEFLEFAGMLWKYYFPVIPGWGMNGITLMCGLNRYFHKNGMNYRSFWCLSEKKMIARIDAMLDQGIPVIFSVGPNFPKIWGKEKLSLYRKDGQGNYAEAAKTKAHYMIITGRDGRWLEVSSWGKKYYIHKAEYDGYVKKFSSFLFSNIVCIEAKKAIK